MADFITLTLTGGKPIRINAAHIVTYERIPEVPAGPNKREEHTMICIGSGEDEFIRVTETPEQIDALLGVTDTVTALVEALQTVRIGCHTAEVNAEARYGKNWRNEVIDAALAKWRGASS